MNEKSKPSVLVVDDERSMREFLEILLNKENYQVTLAANGEEAFSFLEKDKFDLLITDIRMQDVDGIDVLKKAKALSPDTIVIMISAFATAETPGSRSQSSTSSPWPSPS